MLQTRSFVGITLFVIGTLSLAACSSSKDEANTGGASGSGGSATGGAAGSGTGGSAGSATGGSAGTATGGSGGSGGNVHVECPKTTKPTVSAEDLTADATWTSDKVYLVAGELATGAHKLTIEAGTVVCFAPDEQLVHGKLTVEEGGSLDVKGTADNHVVFTRDVEFSTDWDGIIYSGNIQDPGTLEYLDIHWAGASGGDGIFTYNNKKGALLDFRNVTFYSLVRTGITNLLGGWTPETKITINEYDAATGGEPQPPSYYLNYSVLKMRPESVHTILPTTITVAAGVPEQVKYVTIDTASGELLDESFTFPKLPSNLAYYVGSDIQVAGDTTAPNTWTIAPGARIAVNGQIRIGTGLTTMSNIVAVGSAAEPIVFTSASVHTTGEAPAPGDWSAILFYRDNFDPAVSKFEYVHLEYGGAVGVDTLNSCDSNAYGGLIGFNMGFGGPYPGFSIKNSVFEKSSGQAIRSNANPPNLSTDYTAAALSNQFIGFTNPPAQYVGACP